LIWRRLYEASPQENRGGLSTIIQRHRALDVGEKQPALTPGATGAAPARKAVGRNANCGFIY
jgi:hypothetical protein